MELGDIMRSSGRGEVATREQPIAGLNPGLRASLCAVKASDS